MKTESILADHSLTYLLHLRYILDGFRLLLLQNDLLFVKCNLYFNVTQFVVLYQSENTVLVI